MTAICSPRSPGGCGTWRSGSPPPVSGSLQRRLNLAGNPGRWTPDRVLAVKGLGLLAFAVLGALYGLNNPGLLILCVILQEQAKEMQVRRRRRAEGRAQQVPVKITFPLILCLFPALLIMVVGPGIIEIARNLFHNL